MRTLRRDRHENRAEQRLKALGNKFPAPPEELDVEAGRKAAHFAAWEQPDLFAAEMRCGLQIAALILWQAIRKQ